MRSTRPIISIVSILILSGCLLDDGCEEVETIDFSNNEFQAQFTAPHETLAIDDTFRIKIDLPLYMEDIDGVSYKIESLPEVWVRFTDQDKVEPLDTINVFNASGETMHAVFDQYFDMTFIEGMPGVSGLIFLHQTEFSINKFSLDIQYIIRKKGVFKVEVWYHDDIIVESELNTDCINIKEPRIYWADHPANKVFDYYSMDHDQSDKFVFEVR